MNTNAPYWLAVHHHAELSNRFPDLMRRYGDVHALCNAYPGRGTSSNQVTKLIQEPHAPYQRDLAWAQESNHQLLCYDDPAYPPSLRQLKRPPPVLFAIGNLSLLQEPQITVVGSRRPSVAGTLNAEHITRGLAHSGLVITSGLAIGIDTIAHQAALQKQVPTIAVVGTGLDLVYPAKNKDLAREIAQTGLIISEFSCGTPPRPGNFPQRNRLMAALALGVLVVEASERSGSLITARLAGECGREVFAVPGSIRNPCARGCHQLIRDGAHLVESAQDILLQLAPQLRTEAQLDTTDDEQKTKSAATKANKSLTADQQKLLSYMAHDEPLSVDELAQQSGFSAAEVASMLLILELESWVHSEQQVYVRIK